MGNRTIFPGQQVFSLALMTIYSMQVTRIPFQAIDQLSERDKAYQQEDPALRPFYQYPVNLNAFGEVIENRKKVATNRQVLVDALHKQYQGRELSPILEEQLTKLAAPNTFTLVTAHQPSLFTGPLYYIYKIASTINLSRQLNKLFPEVQVVPVFVVGGEDHDFAEINHLSLFGKELRWEQEQGGPVGRLSADTLQPVLDELYEILGDSANAQELKELLEASYREAPSYGRAAADFTHRLFADQGLVVLSMDDADLKRLFIPIMEEEILQQVSKPLVDATKDQLTAAGFSGQAHAREVNIFYLTEGRRDRIVELDDNRYGINGTELSFSREELIAELHNHPERFSPNVIMRPLYQELILPNLAYIGGGGELAYWLERKSQFAHFQLPFPMLIRRNSVLWIDKGSAKKRQSLELEIQDLFLETETLIKQFVKDSSDATLSLQKELEQLDQLFDAVVAKAQEVDKSLVGAVEAERARQQKSLGNLEQRILRAEKQRHEIALNQIRKLQEKLFPGRGLQERSENFMSIYLRHGKEAIQQLIDLLDPMQKEFLVIEDQ
jgi:bacillithiol biosynthesis cysteine-adding enzyme BshC